MPKRQLSNPLALAVLVLLWERPMHPYEMSGTLRERGKQESIKLNFGSLYSIIEGLLETGLIAVQETERDGRRPERTVYAITDAGRAKMAGWLSELLSKPAKEYPQFGGALALMGALPPDEVARLLREREGALEAMVAAIVEQLRACLAGEGLLFPLPRIFLVELEYDLAIRGAELTWVRTLATEIEDGSLGGIDVWAAIHRGEAIPGYLPSDGGES